MVDLDFESPEQPGKRIEVHGKKSKYESTHQLRQLACHCPDLPWRGRFAGPS
jgi:hypothetical protein